MAKKKTQPRRAPRAAEPRMYGDGAPSQATHPGGGAAAPASPAVASQSGAPRNGTPARPANQASRSAAAPARVPVTVTSDYGYVLKDLRRLGILAAVFFAVLIGLGFVIR